MRNKALLTLIAILVSCYFLPAVAALSPEGYWLAIDDITHKPHGIIQLYTVNGILYGKVIKGFPQPGDTPLCEKCPGKFKDKKIVGLQVLWDLKKSSDLEWSGGQVLDTTTGHIYTCKITLNPDNQSLVIRGYMGFSLLGRSQTWKRVGAV